MKLRELIGATACMLSMSAAPAFCQDTPAAPQPERGYMTAIGGASTGAQNTLLFGAEYADHVGPDAEAYTTFSYHDNILSAADRDTLQRVSDAAGFITGLPARFTARDRALVLTLGGKYLVPTGGSIRPYLGAGAGMVNIKRTISDAGGGDITSTFYAQVGSIGGVVSPLKASTTRPIGELLAGVGIGAGRAYVDVGYRFRKVFHAGTSFDFNQISVGVGMRF